EGSVAYTPPSGFVGTVQFEYNVSDGLGGTATAQVIVKVGDLPVSADQFTVLSGTQDNALDVLANDGILPNSPADAWLISEAESATAQVQISDGRLLYTPVQGFTGTDVITYTVEDQSGGTYQGKAIVQVHESGSDRDQGTAKVTINGVNDAPVISGARKFEVINTQVINPFSEIIVTDVDDQGNELLSVSVELSDPDQGILFHPEPGIFSWEGGKYIAKGFSPRQITTILHGLCFQASSGGRVTKGNEEITNIILYVSDLYSETVEDGTAVTAVHPPSSKVLPLNLIGETDSETGSHFGNAVAISGDTMVVGSFLRDVKGIDSGAVYIYERNEGADGQSWILVKILTPEDGLAKDQFGVSLDLVNDTLVVGANLKKVGSKKRAGAVYVFERNHGGDSNWGEVNKITLGDDLSNIGDQFGRSVGLSEGVLIVGAPFSDYVSTDSGAAFVFERNQGGVNNWGMSQAIRHEGDRLDWFGFSVDIDGMFAVIGAPGANRSSDFNDFELGSAYIYKKSSRTEEPWGIEKKLDLFNDPRASRADNFGSSVSIKGTNVVVGSFLFDGFSETGDRVLNSGAAFIYRRDKGGQKNWGKAKDLFSQVPGKNDRFGVSVDIDSRYLVIGTHSINPDFPSGYVQLYSSDISDHSAWNFEDVLLPSRQDRVIGFGSSLALDNGTAVIGAPLDRESALYERSGIVFVNYLQTSTDFHNSDYVRDWIEENFDKEIIERPSLEGSHWGLTADPDSDSYPNGIELLLGTDPNKADHQVITETLINKGSFSFIYPRSKRVPNGLMFTQWSDDLKSWSMGGITETVIEDHDDYELIEAKVNINGSKSIYMRLNFEK
ncbi:MAG: hypothetical protein GWP42_09180, partial [Verrucomicrobiales bacterium]|nr:hypothetical protein [Verrucomicrobiales bacterium]